MPVFKLADVVLHYEVDQFTPPWAAPETVLLMHGNAESGLAWYGRLPHLAPHFRIVRPDMRGYGRSTPMPEDYLWSFDTLADDYCRLMDHLGVDRFHVVAAKIGGTIARAFAARRPDRIKTLTVIGTPQPLRPGAEQIPALIEEYRTQGVEHWARRTMGGRMGDGFPDAGAEWWIRYMGRTAVSSIIGFNRHLNYADIRADLPRIQCPTLVITTEESGLGSVEKTRAWQQTIPDSELLVLPGNSYHVAASHPAECAQATMDFIRRRSC